MVDVALIICVYIAWVLIFWLIFTSPAFGLCLSFTAALFWALIVGLIYILIWYFTINKNNLTSKQKGAMNTILIVAIALPVLVLIGYAIMWVACRPKCADPCDVPKRECPPKPRCLDDGYRDDGYGERSMKATYECSRSTGECVPEKAKSRYGNNVTKINFQP